MQTHIDSSKIELTGDEQYAINQYISSESYKINGKLRNNVKLNRIEKTLEHNLDLALNKCNNYQGNIVRVLDIKDIDKLKEFIQYNKIGTKPIFNEYLSFSNKNNYNGEANVFIYVNSKTAKDLQKYNPEESELLYKRNSKFLVENVIKKDGKYYILWRDISTFAQIKGVFNRCFKDGGKEKFEIAGCKEQMSWTFFWFVLTWRKRKRNEIISKINNVDYNKVHIFKNRRELNKWYQNQFGEKLKV